MARGTGCYAEVTGKCTYKGRMLSQAEYRVDREGEKVLRTQAASH